MYKLVLMENTNVLQHRIERAFSKRGDFCVETLPGKTVRAERVLSDAQHLIIDIDNFEGELYSFLHAIRMRTSAQIIPITLMASRPDERLVLMAAKLGSADVLAKPFSDIDLLKKILKHQSAPLIKDIKLGSIDRTGFKFKWSSEYEIGIELIDREHKQIVDNFQLLYEKINTCEGTNSYHDMLLFLNEYISFHFEHEEALQKKINYDVLEQHAAQHHHFRQTVIQIAKHGQGDAVTNDHLVKLVLFIKEWLIHHILVEDKKIGDFVRRLSD